MDCSWQSYCTPYIHVGWLRRLIFPGSKQDKLYQSQEGQIQFNQLIYNKTFSFMVRLREISRLASTNDNLASSDTYEQIKFAINQRIFLFLIPTL